MDSAPEHLPGIAQHTAKTCTCTCKQELELRSLSTKVMSALDYPSYLIACLLQSHVNPA